MPPRFLEDRRTLVDFGDSPVESSIRELLAGAVNEDSLDQLHRYQRKLDITRRLLRSYANGLGQATTDKEISSAAYLAVAQALAGLASREAVHTEDSRARLLRYVNSAFNSLDRVKDPEVREGEDFATLLRKLDQLAVDVVR